MVTFTEAELLAWLTPLLWPFLRALALFSALPVLGQRTVPTRVRIGLAFLIALAAQASLPAMPLVALDSPLAFMLVLQQVLIGLTLGFAVRVVFAAVEFAGELIGLQMGLNFAGFFDPASGGQATAASRFFGTTVGCSSSSSTATCWWWRRWCTASTPSRSAPSPSPSCAPCNRNWGPRSSRSGCGSRCR